MSTKSKDEKPESNYARKRKWCARNGKWGFEVPEPKPWKKRGAKGGAR